MPRTPLASLLALALLAVLVDGYHFGVDDAEIYIPAIKQIVNPQLYPFGAEFFLNHAHLSLFARTVGGFARLTHLSVEWVALLTHLGCTFLLLVAGWRVAAVFFLSRRACWGATGLLAACLPVPVAGIALVLSDPYLSARSFSAPVGLLALSFLLRGRLGSAALITVLTALFHPQMAVYCVAFAMLFWAVGRSQPMRPQAWAHGTASVLAWALPGWALPDGLTHYFEPATGAYRTVLYARTYFFARNWEWYEWVGAVAPLLLLAIAARSRWGRQRPVRAQTCYALIALALISTLFFLIFSADHHFDNLTRLQPMRSFHIVYLFLFLILGGLLGEHVLRARCWAWLALFLPIAAGMYTFDRSDYPFSPHLEWPGHTAGNPWMDAFRWVRRNTPIDAVFALDPNTMAIPADDRHGFRALSERSALADAYKDSGAAAMFPHLVPDWEAQQKLQAGWTHFAPADFARLAARSPVTWVVVENGLSGGLACPYRNASVSVCRVAAGPEPTEPPR